MTRVFSSTLVLAIACTGSVSPPGGEPPEMRPPPARSSDHATESGARRLSQAELNNTLFELFGDTSRPAERYLNEDEFSPYDNDYTKQRASATLITGLEQLSIDVASRALADPTIRSRLVPCEPTGPGDTECLRAFIESFVPRALRRPITEYETASYLTLQAFATEDNEYVDNDFYTAVGLIVQAIVQDPEFLYRIEVGAPSEWANVFRLDDYELATRLSYLLWGTTPDDALLADAAAGRLVTADGRRAAAERLLDDPRAREQVHRFHTMWLGYRTIPVDAALVPAMNDETNALLDRVIFDQRASYFDVFTSTETFVNDALATHYGLESPGGEGWVPYGATGRAGILSHGTVLAAFSKFNDTSPTQRGILVRTRLMCSPVLPPPPTVDVDNPPGEGSSDCKTQRYMAHMGSPSCNACHGTIDPIGFGLEQYDIQGRFRTHDDGRPECELDGMGTYPSGGSFSGPAELATRVIEDGSLERCVMEHWYTYAIGRTADSVEAPVIEGLAESFRNGSHDLRALILDYVSSERFALRREEVL